MPVRFHGYAFESQRSYAPLAEEFIRGTKLVGIWFWVEVEVGSLKPPGLELDSGLQWVRGEPPVNFGSTRVALGRGGVLGSLGFAPWLLQPPKPT